MEFRENPEKIRDNPGKSGKIRDNLEKSLNFRENPGKSGKFFRDEVAQR